MAKTGQRTISGEEHAEGDAYRMSVTEIVGSDIPGTEILREESLPTASGRKLCVLISRKDHEE